ncbi:MAG: PIN domain-containing protein, partial [Kiritimatiellaeota bacterium]|nr:PIN domain-containing protein [Kiritimatiellota bacterium]
HTITNVFYILRKDFSKQERKLQLLKILSYIDVVPIGKHQIVQALKNDDIGDFEDALQLECAREFNADYIVTRDPEHFKKSEIETISPAEFIAKHGGK